MATYKAVNNVFVNGGIIEAGTVFESDSEAIQGLVERGSIEATGEAVTAPAQTEQDASLTEAPQTEQVSPAETIEEPNAPVLTEAQLQKDFEQTSTPSSDVQLQ